MRPLNHADFLAILTLELRVFSKRDFERERTCVWPIEFEHQHGV